MKDTKEYKQLLWHSRRGMRELDAFFIPFTTDVYCGLSSSEQQAYRELIAQGDDVLFSWFLNSVSAGTRQKLIDKIISHARHTHR